MSEAAASPSAASIAVLATFDTPRAQQLLEAAINIPRPSIQTAAATALLQQSTTQARLLVFERLEEFPREVLTAVQREAPRLAVTLRQLLLQGNPATRATALRVIRLACLYGQVGQVIELMNRKEFEAGDIAVDTFRSLVNSLYDEWYPAGHTLPDLRCDAVRLPFLLELQKALSNWEGLAYPHEIVEAALALSEPGHVIVKQVLWNGIDPCKTLAGQLLQESRHPGVMRLAAESLTEPYPHPKVFLAIRTRHDPEFLSALMTVIGRKRSQRQLGHLRQIQQLDWLEPPFDLLAGVPPTLQPALIAFINSTRIDRELKAGVQEWMLRYGSPDGKRAATAGLTLVDEEVIQEVVRDSLESEDADVQAWAMSNLRQHAIPEAFAILIERLDSPLESVQQAAREELSAFNVPRVLALADELPLDEARRAGILMMKVDVSAPEQIRRFLAHPIRQKRISSARQIARLGLQSQFVSAFAVMASDSDAFTRRTAAQVLATIPAVEAYRALLLLQDDPHPRVRETAIEALQRWNHGQDADDASELELFELKVGNVAEW